MLAARLPFVAVALVCAGLGIYLALSSGGEARLHRANAHMLAGRDAAALAELRGLEGEPGRRAAALRGYAQLGRGQLRQARTAFRQAVQRDPNNWVLHRDYAIVLRRLGDRARARTRMGTALALNPRMILPPGFAAAK